MDPLNLSDLRIDEAEDIACIFSILSCCSKDLGVQGLARIASSSKSLNDACVAIARRDAPQLLEAAAAQAAAALGKQNAAAGAAAKALSNLMCSAMHRRRCLELEEAAQAAYSQKVHAVAWLLRTARQRQHQVQQ
jgi:hypothetical protein